MAGGRALPGDESQDPVRGELDGLTGGQILRRQQEGTVGEPGAAAAGEDVVDPPGHVPDIGGTALHVLVIHGGEEGSEFLSRLQGRLRGGSASGDGGGHGLQIVRILQHQHLDFHDGGLVLAYGLPRVFVQLRKLLPCGLPGVDEPGLLLGGCAGGQGRGCGPSAPDHGGTHGDARVDPQAGTLLHNGSPPDFFLPL